MDPDCQLHTSLQSGLQSCLEANILHKRAAGYREKTCISPKEEEKMSK